MGTPTVSGKADYTVSVNGNVVTITSEDVSKDRATEITFTIRAKIKADVTDAKLLEKYSSLNVPNKAQVKFDDKAEMETNTVTVTPPQEPGEEPVKKVNGKEAETLTTRTEAFTYTITQKVPTDAVKLSFRDTLEDVLEVVGTPTVSGKADYTVSVNGNVVTITSEDVSKDRATEITFTIRAKIKADVTDAQLLEKYSSLNVPNKAQVTFDDKAEMETNTVTVTPPQEPGENPEKKVNGKEAETLTTRTEEFTYTITQKVPTDAVKLSFRDTLEDVLEIVGTPTVSGKADYTVSVNGNVVTITSEDVSKDRATEITFTIQAKIKADVTDAQLLEKYSSLNVPNKAQVKFDDKAEMETNTVTVTPPQEPGEEPVKKVNGKEAETLTTRTEEFTYTITQKVPTDAVKLSFRDTLEDVLEVVGTPTVSGKADYTVKVEGNVVTITSEDVSKDRATEITFTIRAKIKADVTDAKLLEKYSSLNVPNKAQVTFDDKAEMETNTVTVTPPQEPGEDPVKKVNGKEAETLTTRTEEFTYTITQKVPTDAVKLSFRDTLEDVLEVVGTPTVSGKADYTVSVNGNEVTITSEDVSKDRATEITFTIRAKIKADVTDAKLLEKYSSLNVPNKAQVRFDDKAEMETNTVTVTPPQEPGENPEKKVNGKEAETLTTRTEAFTYTITQKVPTDAVKLSFRDTLEDVLEVVGTPTVSGKADYTVSVNGNEVTITSEDVSKDRATEITFTIQAKIKADVTDAQLLEKYSSLNVPNKAKVTFDDKAEMETNTVTVTPPQEPGENPEKKVNGKEAETLTIRTEEFTYTITQKVPTDAVKLSFTDTLEDVLEVVGTPTVSGKADYTVSVNGNVVTITSEDVSKDRATEITFTIQAKIKADVTDAQLLEKYSSLNVPNKAKVTFDDKAEMETNTVTVTPPQEPGEDPVKKVNGKEHEVLKAREEVFTYTITQIIPVDTAKVVYTDILEGVLEVVGEPAISDGTKAVVNGQTVTATLEGDALKAYWGKTLTLTIQAKIKADVKDEQLLAKYGSLNVPNEAEVKLDNKEAVKTDPVTVTPPPEDEEVPVKKVNGKEHEDLKAREEVLTYTITQKVPVDTGKVVFTDILEDVLEVVGEPALSDGTKAVVNGQTVTATLEGDALKAYWGKTLTLTIQAKIKADVTDEQLLAKYGSLNVPNEAEVKLDNKEAVKTDPVTVTPPPEDEEVPVKKVNGKEHEDLKAWEEVFTYTITQKIPVDTAKVVYTDILEGVLEVVGESALSDGTKAVVNGQTVTATLEGDALKAYWGKTLTLTIQAKIKADVTDEQLLAKYGSLNVPNEAEVKLDNKEAVKTDPVTVTPPEELEPETESTTSTENGESETPEPSSQEEDESDEPEPDDGGSIPPIEDEESNPVGDETEVPTEASQPEPTLPPEEIETEPSQSVPPAPESEAPTLPDTGDHSNMLLYFGLMCLAAAGSGLLVAKGKKKED